MRRSIFTTIHMNVLCDDGHIMAHVIENDNACDLYTTIIIIMYQLSSYFFGTDTAGSQVVLYSEDALAGRLLLNSSINMPDDDVRVYVNISYMIYI